jgi:guanylate kinase
MTPAGVILYGPPASGKDAVTEALVELDPTFRHYARFKAGTGRTRGYEMIGEECLAAMREQGHVLYENARYGNRYVVDRPRLQEMFDTGAVPVVHIGQIAGIRAITCALPVRWMVVMLWCSRETAKKRAKARDASDIDSRIVAWGETERDIADYGTDDFKLWIDTEEHRPADAAQLIRDTVRSGVSNAG